MQDLIIRNGRVIDWATHTDTVTDIAISGSRISKVGHCEDKANIEISADGLWVVPGIIDSHMHASSWLGGEKSMRMLAMAGVTTALEMAGPIESVKTFMKNAGTGLTIGCLEQIRPGYNVSSQSPSNEELERVIETSLENGAFGVKLLGGHYPLTPEATARLIRLCSDMKVYLAVHAGSTENGSNILGMREVIELADGIPFHLAHINAYCRGSIFGLDQEICEASAMLLEHPGECQDFCVWGGYSRGSPTRLPFVFEMQYARPDAIAGAKVEGPARSAGGSSLAPAIARREAAGALAREV